MQEDKQCTAMAITVRAPDALSSDEVTANQQLRSSIRVDLQLLQGRTPSRERAIAVTKLQEALSWLDMDNFAREERNS